MEDKPITFIAKVSHFSIESRSFQELKSFVLRAKVARFRSQCQRTELVSQYALEVVEKLLEV